MNSEAANHSYVGVFDALSRLGCLGSYTPGEDPGADLLRHASLFFDRFTGYGLTYYLDQVEAGTIDLPTTEGHRRVATDLQDLRDRGLLLEPSQFGAEDEFQLFSSIDSDRFRRLRLVAVKLAEMTKAARLSWLRSGGVEAYPGLDEEMQFLATSDIHDFPPFADLYTGAVFCAYIGDLTGVFQAHLMAYGLRIRGLSATVIDTQDRRSFLYQREVSGETHAWDKVKTLIEEFGEAGQEAYRIVIDHVPVPSATVSWEDLIHIREDSEIVYRLRKIRRWANDLASDGRSPQDIVTDLEDRLADYKRFLSATGVKTTTGWIEALVVEPVGILEDLAKLNVRAIAERPFKILKAKQDIALRELAAPGREVSFIVHVGTRVKRD